MILVTGGSGLVGSHLLHKLLKSKESVRVLIRTKESISSIETVFSYYNSGNSDLLKKVEWVYGDILNKSDLAEAFKNVNKVYHCAAYVSFNEKERKVINEINIIGTRNIVNACIGNEVDKLVYVSSVAAVKVSPDSKYTSEANGWPGGKLTAYPNSKTQSEYEVWRGIAEGLNAIIVNPSVILGPGNWDRGSSLIIKKVYKGMKYYTSGKTGFVDVRDVVDAMVLLMKSDIHSRRFILNGANLSYQTLFTKLARYLKVKPPEKQASPVLTELAWRLAKIYSILTISQPVITKNAVRASRRIQNYSSERIIEETGFRFTNIEETISFTCTNYLEAIEKK